MSRVLVTGAGGNVGREVVRECLQAGFSVRAADRRARPTAGCEAVAFDFLDPLTWPQTLDGCQYLFLLRPPPLGDMERTLNPFVDAAYQSGVQHIVFMSVAGAERMRWVPHRKVELHLAQTGRHWTVLRPGFFAQNLQDAYLKDIVEDGRLFVPAGQGRVAFLDVRDIAEVAAHVFRSPHEFRGEALTLTGPEALTFGQTAEVLSHALGRPIRYQPASLPGYVWHLKSRRHLSWGQVAVQTFLHAGLRAGDAEPVVDTVQRLLGHSARTVAEYVRDHRSVWRRDRTGG